MTTHVVTKQLSANKQTYQPGDEVDATAWRNAHLLEEQRYIRPIRPDERDKRVGRKETNANTRN